MVESCAAFNCTTRRKKNMKLKFHRIPKNPLLKKQWLNALRRENFNPGSRSVICEKHFTAADYAINAHGNRVLKTGAVPSVFVFLPVYNPIPEKGDLLRRLNEESEKKDSEESNDLDDHAESSPSPASMEIDENKKEERHENNDMIGKEERYENSDIDVNGENQKEERQPNIEIEVGDENEKQERCENTEIEVNTKEFVTRNRRYPCFFGDFKEEDLEDPERRATFWRVAHETITKYKKLNKYYQCTLRRQKEKIKHLSVLLDEVIQNKEKNV